MKADKKWAALTIVADSDNPSVAGVFTDDGRRVHGVVQVAITLDYSGVPRVTLQITPHKIAVRADAYELTIHDVVNRDDTPF